MGKSLISPRFLSPTSPSSTVFCGNCGFGWSNRDFWHSHQRSGLESSIPNLSSQLHLGVAMHLPLGSMGSHYHRHMLMTPINSPSVGPKQPSALKVKGRGIGSGQLFPRMTVQARVWLVCVQARVLLSLCCLVYREHVHPSLVYITCTRVHSECVHCGYKVFMCTKCSKPCIYVPSTVHAFCVKMSAYKLGL